MRHPRNPPRRLLRSCIPPRNGADILGRRTSQFSLGRESNIRPHIRHASLLLRPRPSRLSLLRPNDLPLHLRPHLRRSPNVQPRPPTVEGVYARYGR